MANAKGSQPLVYQLKVTLKGAKFPIWCRLLVADDITHAKRHAQAAASSSWRRAGWNTSTTLTTGGRTSSWWKQCAPTGMARCCRCA